MEIFQYLDSELMFHKFIIEILDKNGFDNIIKLKIITKETLEHMLEASSSEIETYKYFKKYDAAQLEAYDALKDKASFKLKIKPGDYWQILALPNLLEKVPQQLKKENTVKETPSKGYRRPKTSRKRAVVTQSEEIAPKKSKLIPDLDRLGQLFGTFVRTIDYNIPSQVVDSGKEYPDFYMFCTKCDKDVKMGFKKNKSGQPSFIRTNWESHRCNKGMEMKKERDADPLIFY